MVWNSFDFVLLIMTDFFLVLAMMVVSLEFVRSPLIKLLISLRNQQLLQQEDRHLISIIITKYIGTPSLCPFHLNVVGCYYIMLRRATPSCYCTPSFCDIMRTKLTSKNWYIISYMALPFFLGIYSEIVLLITYTSYGWLIVTIKN